MPEVICIGEALIDFLSVERHVLIEQTTGFTVAPGGAPANVSAAVARLGGSAGFIGKVGRDSFGAMIRNALSGVGVDVGQLVMDPGVNTTLAFIAVKDGGEPDFVFYRNHCGADLALRPDEIGESYVRGSSVLHFGSLSLSGEPLRSATLKALSLARDAGLLISFDPNLRPSLWDDLARARDEMENGLSFADVVKLTDEELRFITGSKNIDKGTRLLLQRGPKLVVVTRGSRSCFVNCAGELLEAPVFRVNAVDTTGGGDAFVGGFLVQLLKKMQPHKKKLKRDEEFFGLERVELLEMVRFANACGALTVTRKGVIPALPAMEEVEGFLKAQQQEKSRE